MQPVPLSASPDTPFIWFKEEPVPFVFLSLVLCFFLQRKVRMSAKTKQKLELTSAKLFKMRNFLQSKLTDRCRVAIFHLLRSSGWEYAYYYMEWLAKGALMSLVLGMRVQYSRILCDLGCAAVVASGDLVKLWRWYYREGAMRYPQPYALYCV